jgi:hypothetical protein
MGYFNFEEHGHLFKRHLGNRRASWLSEDLFAFTPLPSNVMSHYDVEGRFSTSYIRASDYRGKHNNEIDLVPSHSIGWK